MKTIAQLTATLLLSASIVGLAHAAGGMAKGPQFL